MIVRRALSSGGAIAVAVVLLALTACTHVEKEDTGATLDVMPRGAAMVRFAVIGDYGLAGPAAAAVADLVKSWKPDFIITTGDNNYPAGAAETIDQNIGQYYGDYIAPYKGVFGAGAATNRFFPSLGNHDLHTADGAPYFAYFTLPGNGRYYDFNAGPIHFFALDSDFYEPDGTSSTSRQGRWVQKRLGDSHACWHIVYFHHPPYASSGKETLRMRWPFTRWGVDVVLAGHQHTYERLSNEGVTYIVVGLSGAEIDPLEAPSPFSQTRFNADHGALFGIAEGGRLTFEFRTSAGVLIDTDQLKKSCDRTTSP